MHKVEYFFPTIYSKLNLKKVTYQSRPVESDAYKKNMAAQRIVVTEFGTAASYTDPCHTIFQRLRIFVRILNFKSLILFNLHLKNI